MIKKAHGTLGFGFSLTTLSQRKMAHFLSHSLSHLFFDVPGHGWAHLWSESLCTWQIINHNDYWGILRHPVLRPLGPIRHWASLLGCFVWQRAFRTLLLCSLHLAFRMLRAPRRFRRNALGTSGVQRCWWWLECLQLPGNSDHEESSVGHSCIPAYMLYDLINLYHHNLHKQQARKQISATLEIALVF